ncbi:hypothetical protein BAUCODRAFT_29212 [Baudoinia panamericana UAMH 10762]|uniref:Uncharacterized protein n=1 Tax=Baudoinia panamericana (strain UAMH 10762) TaxID=717646 RepID=M2NNL7_BAUPA|nr:uncharacterized protein BAUCODRAFT_29212 [Baudoinia panamericana UAMH 10762]EMD00831.1 hypothetical protein BAUCODRAFT_29212 [Baudoinia panamericana UAMH 10762]
MPAVRPQRHLCLSVWRAMITAVTGCCSSYHSTFQRPTRCGSLKSRRWAPGSHLLRVRITNFAGGPTGEHGAHQALWDCRVDCQALLGQYGTELNSDSIMNAQLLDLAITTKHRQRKKVSALCMAVQKRVILLDQGRAWLEDKTSGELIMRAGPMREGQLAAELKLPCLNEKVRQSNDACEKKRAMAEAQALSDLIDSNFWDGTKACANLPLPDAMIRYAPGHVATPPILHSHYEAHPALSEVRRAVVELETRKRVLEGWVQESVLYLYRRTEVLGKQIMARS